MGALPSLWDTVVVAAYVPALVLFGAWVSRRQLHPEDYFLASPGSRWLAICLALLASNISSSALVGLARAAYATGLPVDDHELAAAGTLVVCSAFSLAFV